jgi:PEP-CTERM motif
MPTLRSLMLFSILVLVFGLTDAKADSINMSASGTWGAGTPTTTYSAAGDPWSFSFNLSNPVTDATVGNVLGGLVTQQFSNFSYFLNNGLVATTADLTGVELFPTSNLGGFDLIFGNATVSLYGAQLYNGTAPTLNLLPGSFTMTSAMNNADPTGSGTVNIVSTPEPASGLLLGIGLFGLLVMRRKFQPMIGELTSVKTVV